MYRKDDIINVIVTSIKDYGVFVKTDSNYTGLIHISEINGKFVNNINSLFKINTTIKARILNIDEEKKQLELSTKKPLIKRNKSFNKLKEIGNGFDNLRNKLPKWIDETKKEIEKDK